MKQVIVTTSWDDGHLLDSRLAALLKKYNLAATFYISPQDQEIKPSERLKLKQIKALSQFFEIGAHTMTHPRLPKISDAKAKQEIVNSKQYLEKITGQKIISFCYPGGNYKKRHAAMVRAAGLQYARTVRRHSFSLKGSLFEAGTTIHAYNHFQDLWKIACFARFNPRRIISYSRWDNLAKAMFDQVFERGGVYHLWGHSWEIEAQHDWKRLESVLRYIARHPGVRYLTNGEQVQFQERKLLIAAPYFPPHLGGQENYAFRIAQELQRQAWEVCIATTGKRGWRLTKSKYHNLTIYRLPYLFKISNTPFHPYWYFWLRRIIRQENIDIVDAHAPVPLFADIVTRAAKHLPVVVTYHMLSMKKGRLPEDWLIGIYEKYLLPKTLDRAELIVCASDAVRHNFLQRFSQKSYTITPGVDSDFFKPAPKRPNNTILFVGSLNKSDNHKGLPYLLEAFSQIAINHPEAKLVIVGVGSGRKNYEAQAKQLGLAERITFLGGCYGSDLKHVYQQATMFVLPAINDNFPLTILEAMASGLPVISTPVGSIPQLVEEAKTGYLVPVADSPAVAVKLKYLLTHPAVAKRLGVTGRQKVAHVLNWRTQADKTSSLLRTGSL